MHIPGFEQQSLSFNDETRTVYRTGSGPAVIVMSEMPGITPQVADFARKVAEDGFTVFMPQLFGQPVTCSLSC